MTQKAKTDALKGAALLALLAALGLLVLLLLKRPERPAPKPEGQRGVSAKLDGLGRSARSLPPSRQDLLGRAPVISDPKDADEYLRRLSEMSLNSKEEALLFARREGARFGEAGVVAEARDAMAVTLLVDLGRMDEARASVRRFLSLFPESRYRALVQGVTGIHPRPGPPAHIRP